MDENTTGRSTGSSGPEGANHEGLNEAQEVEGESGAQSGTASEQQPNGEKGEEAPYDPRPRVVGIGASAGGVEALMEFFAAMPSDTGMSFAVVMHLSPDHESGMAEVLTQTADMPVTEVTGTVPIEPNHVYVIPPDRHLEASGESLALSDFDEPRGKRTPINHFFRSLAATYGEQCAALVFSGGGTDGAVGIKAVKEAGGLVMVQDPDEAEHGSMPRSAISTKLVDIVLPVGTLAQRLADIERRRVALPRDPAQLEEEQEQMVRRVLRQLRERVGHDFGSYKRSTILRRIQRRMQINDVTELHEYLAFLKHQPKEYEVLFREMLIGVTNFFRDPEAFDALEANVIPQLFEGKGKNDTVRVWVVGCATGEEAYSIAMLLAEHTLRLDDPPGIQIFATDLDEDALQTAREGVYPRSIESDVIEERLKRFFIPDGNRYRVVPELRDMVLFSTHSVLKDPPFSRLDLISCRNLLIYMQRDLQDRVFQTFHYALRPERYLFLGMAETTNGVAGLFRAMDKKHCLYQARVRSSEVASLPVLSQTIARPRTPPVRKASTQAREVSEAKLHRAALEEYAPPSVLVDEGYRVVHLSEQAGRYLQPPGGALTSNITELVRPEMRVVLRSALFQAFDHGQPTVALPVPVQFNGHHRTVYLTVRADEGRQGTERFALIIFNEGAEEQVRAPHDGDENDPEKRRMADELQRTRERLQTSVEEFESSQEEMKAQNEELQSVNEEYKSTMEELETSKEELQSVNEELRTVNSELQLKLEEISRAHSDLQNLMAATDVATLFLDRQLQIQRYTPGVEQLFNMKATDTGRLVSDLTHKLAYATLEADAQRVLDDLVPVEREVQSRGGRWFIMRMRPYRTVEDKIDGIVITFVDITQRRDAEQALRESEERYRLLMANVEEYAIFMLNPDGHVTDWGVGARRLFGYTEDEVMGHPAALVFTEEAREAGAPQQEMDLAARDGEVNGERWCVRKDGSRFWAVGVLSALYHPDGELRGFAKVMRDQTKRKQMEEELERRVRERTQQVRELTSTLTMAEQQERRRLSQILHDDLQQRLYAIQMNVTSLKDECQAGDQQAVIEHAREINEWMKEAIQTTRQLSVDLSPPVLKDEGLREALGWLRTQMEDMYALQLTVKGESPSISDEGMEALLFQIVRELLFNVVKHADTDEATVELVEDDYGLLLRVTDEGRGFDAEASKVKGRQANGLGLFSVRERVRLFGGEMQIESEPGAGTRITIRIPLDAASAPESNAAP